MSEMTPAEAKQQLTNKIENIGKYFERNISENVTRYIFGGTKIPRYVKRVTDYASYFNNIFSLAFVFAYGCLRYDAEGEEPLNPKFTKQSALRIINSLKKAYNQYPVTSELIQFVLSDIQFEIIQGGGDDDNEGIYEIFGRICDFKGMNKYSLSKYYKVISQWRAAPSRFTMDGLELAEMFDQLIKKMTFLRTYDIVMDEYGTFAFIDKEAMEYGDLDTPYAVVPAGRILYYDPNLYLDFYSLYSAEKQGSEGSRSLVLKYVTGDGFKSLTFRVDETEPENESEREFHINSNPGIYYTDIFGVDWDYEGGEDSKKNSNFIDQVHAINYKYIKNLALAISDTVSANRGAKKALYNAYRIRHRDVFREVEERLSEEPDIDNIKMDWDSIIVMLLIESSPTSVLETLFRHNRQAFIAVALNLKKRIDNPDLAFHGKTDTELKRMVDDIVRTKLIVGETGGFGRIPRNQSDDVRLLARAEALFIVSSLSAVHEEETVEKTICAGNIYDNLTLLSKIKTEFPADQRCKYTSVILGETFRHLLCFYRGLFAYGEIKATFDAESGNRVFSEAQIASYQKQMQTAFMEAAKAEAEAVKELDSSEHSGMMALLERFIRLCETCGSTENTMSTNGHSLFAVLGKHEMMNVSEFKEHVSVFTSTHCEINDRNVDQWITFAVELLRYLRKGNLEGGEESPFKAVYPFAATYNKGNENYDGYKTVTFTLNFDIDGDDRSDVKEYINVLTEFTYSTTNVFYCLPNVLRSNKRWWIDPLLVSFKDFNDIFVE